MSQKARKTSSKHPNRSSCHQCKTLRRVEEIMFCENLQPSSRSTRKCRKKYCHMCLRKGPYNYMQDVSSGGQKPWICPACRGICTCAQCKKSKNKAAGKQKKAPKRKAASPRGSSKKKQQKAVETLVKFGALKCTVQGCQEKFNNDKQLTAHIEQVHNSRHSVLSARGPTPMPSTSAASSQVLSFSRPTSSSSSSSSPSAMKRKQPSRPSSHYDSPNRPSSSGSTPTSGPQLPPGSPFSASDMLLLSQSAPKPQQTFLSEQTNFPVSTHSRTQQPSQQNLYSFQSNPFISSGAGVTSPGSSPMGSSPMGSSPMGSSPMGSSPIGQHRGTAMGQAVPFSLPTESFSHQEVVKTQKSELRGQPDLLSQGPSTSPQIMMNYNIQAARQSVIPQQYRFAPPVQFPVTFTGGVVPNMSSAQQYQQMYFTQPHQLGLNPMSGLMPVTNTAPVLNTANNPPTSHHGTPFGSSGPVEDLTVSSSPAPKHVMDECSTGSSTEQTGVLSRTNSFDEMLSFGLDSIPSKSEDKFKAVFDDDDDVFSKH